MQTPSASFVKTFAVQASGKALPSQVIEKGKLRFTVLTDRLLRVEVDQNGAFCDKPTCAVLFRDFDQPAFKAEEEGGLLKITTAKTIFSFDLRRKKMQAVSCKGGARVTDFEAGNLGGTARTLDTVNGAIRLQKGLMSRSGVSVMDDTKSCIIAEDGTILARPKTHCDLYYFAYGTDYRGCLRDFFRLTGQVPLVPRWSLSNWWSRYKAYSQQEYLDLMQAFIDRKIPITVATIDMDWHWTDVVQRFGKDARFRYSSLIPRYLTEPFQMQGWTGYSWNTELFPDYKKMLAQLHDEGFIVTLNLHPAQGVRPFEDQYAQMAAALGMDPLGKEHIRFDITDPRFTEAYFNILHRPYEQDGVRFWWIDWQQEKTTAVPGLDPLWALNHYHTLAFSQSNKRPLILSRFAGAGSHRYPLGFSGDAVISWKSLDFQPFFTATASNIGYTWWSHDIGGHMLGVRDDELYARWVQFGQYSPIMRLHSTKDEFMGKEPWKYGKAAENAAVAALRERHAMLPYLYSMNRRTHTEGRALLEPMYYAFPNEDAAYETPNQYFFGSELLVRPVTHPANKTTGLAGERVWLPRGRWTDWYTGAIYEGGGWITMFRPLESIPVLAKEGAIVPLGANRETNDWQNPQALLLRVFRGNGSFNLYEDDGETTAFEAGAFAETALSVREYGDTLRFIIGGAKGDLSVLPQTRSYTVLFDDLAAANDMQVLIDGRARKAQLLQANDSLRLILPPVSPAQQITIELHGTTPRRNKDKQAQIVNLLSRYQMTTLEKNLTFSRYLKDVSQTKRIKDPELRGPLEEILQMK